MSEKYKLIEINLDGPLSDKEMKAVLDLEKKFPNSDLFFKISDSKLNLYLREIDFKYFKEMVRKLMTKYTLSESNNILLEILVNIENIRSYGLRGGKRIYVGYNRERKVKNRKHKEKKRGMFYYALNSNFSEEVNELPEKFVNKIICGDSEHILKQLPDNCIDIVFTSPPYNFGLDYDTSEDGIDWNRYFNKLFAIFRECIRVLKYGGRIIVNVQPLFSDYIPIHHIISNFFMENKLIWKGEILWEKHNYNCKYTAWGSWKSPSNPYLKYTWEFLEIFCKGDLKKTGSRGNIDITGDEFKKWVYAKWDIAPERNMKEWDHPAMFPEELVRRVLKLFSYRKDIVLDPFNGVGTTTKVAKELGRRYVGIDISEEYCKKAEERIKRVTYQKTLC